MEPISSDKAPRRDFLLAAGALGVGAALGLHAGAQPPAAANGDAIPQRPFGRSGFRVSALGLGGHHLGEILTVDEALRLVHAAIDAGITFLDNCWEYYN